MPTVFRILGPTAIDLTDTTKYVGMYGSAAMDRQIDQALTPVPSLAKVIASGRHPGALKFTVDLAITGSTFTVLADNYNAIAKQIELAVEYAESNKGSGNVVLEYQPTGANFRTTYDIVGGQLDPMPSAGEPAGKWALHCKLTLMCQPYGYYTGETNQTIASNVANYTLTSALTPVGTARAPGKVYIKNRTASSTYEYIRVGNRSQRAGANFVGPYFPGTGSPSGYAVARGTGSTPSGNNIVFTLANLATNGNMAGATGGTSGSELVADPGFELSTTWTPVGSQGFNDTSTPHAGTHNGTVLGGDGTTAFFQQIVTGLVPGQAYRFEIWMRSIVTQQIGVGAMCKLTNVGHGVYPTGTFPGDGSKTMVENTATYTKHTWDFMAANTSIEIRLYNTGVGAAFFDDVTLKVLNELPTPGWASVGFTSAHKAVDTEGEPAGQRTWNGGNALAVGPGAANASYVFTSFAGVSGATYRVRCVAYVTAGAGYAHMTVGASGAGSTSFDAKTISTGWTLLEGTIYAGTGATTIVVELYCDSQTAAIYDSVQVLRENDAANELARFTITSNISYNTGIFRCYARVKVTGQSFALQSKYGGPTGQVITNPPSIVAASTTFRVVDLGRVALPEFPLDALSMGITALSFGIWLDQADMDDIADVDTSSTCEIAEVELVPIDEWFFEVETPAGQGIATNEYLIVDATQRVPICYHADSSAFVIKELAINGTWPYLIPTGNAKLCVHVARSRSDDRGSADSFDTIWYSPGAYDWVHN